MNEISKYKAIVRRLNFIQCRLNSEYFNEDGDVYELDGKNARAFLAKHFPKGD